MRTRIILSSLIAGLGTTILVAVSLGANSSEATRSGAIDRVVAGFYPLAFAAEQVGGPGVEVDNLTPPGVEPHDVEVSSDDVRALASADLVLLMGNGFQPQLEQVAGEGDAQLVEALDTPGLDLRDDDPHVWLDPLRYALIAERVAQVLGRPGAAEPLVRRLQALDRDYRGGLADCARDEIVTNHDAFGYLAERYGLRQVPVTGLSPEAEPSPAALADVIDGVRASGATTVFAEPLLPRSVEDTIARETGTQVATLNPLESLTEAEQERGDDYFTVMRRNLAALREGLGCR
jgi:zinc transport system substrate-binding protein